MRRSVLALAGLLALPAVVHAAETSPAAAVAPVAAPVAAAAPATVAPTTVAQMAAPEKPKLICRKDVETGSIIKATKQCHTAKEWQEIRSTAQGELARSTVGVRTTVDGN